MTNDSCDLCRLSLRQGLVRAEIEGQRLRFCCRGCEQVYRMLLESSEERDPSKFRETELYRRCVEAGVIPASEEDLPAQPDQRPTGPGPSEGAHPRQSVEGESVSGEALSLELEVRGMWCPACAWVVEQAARKVPGVSHAACQFVRDRVNIRYDPVRATPHQIKDAIRKLGYFVDSPQSQAARSESRQTFLRLALSCFLTVNVMMLSLALYSGFFTELSQEAVAKISWPIAILGTAVFAYGGAPIHRRAVSGLLSGTPGMEALISLGATSALLYSYLNWLQGSIHLYFDTASMLITIVLIGKALEHRSKEDVLSQLDSFFALLPSKVRVCSEAFPRGRYVDASLLTAGDVFRVIEGENVPADGRIVSGQGRVDESSLTGEARPLEKQSGDLITSGTKVSSGSFRVKAQAVGADSMIGQLMAIMEQALERKTGLESITDKVLRIFVPAIVGLALATGGVCLALGLDPRASFVRAITVLVISCPCALGVAIPLARVAGISLAGKMGVLVHDFSVFQRIRDIQAVVFDKTGTLTKGRWELVDILPLQGMAEEEILALASGLETHSQHYVAQALVQAAQDRGIAPYEVHSVEQQDNGISGCSGDAFIRIGSASFVGRACSIENKEHPNPASRGEPILSRVYMAVDGLPVAVFRFGDALRESSRSVVERLQQQGLRLALVSGDSEQTTSSIGRTLGIDACHGDMRPADKAAFVESLKKQGFCVAMLGDGVNDVPALASADVGIGVHNGWQIGREASSMTLMGNDPQQLFRFMDLAGRVARTIRQNLAFTFIYNGVSIPIAMSGLLNPLVAVTAMLLSSLSVTGNTLLLSRQKIGGPGPPSASSLDHS